MRPLKHWNLGHKGYGMMIERSRFHQRKGLVTNYGEGGGLQNGRGGGYKTGGGGAREVLPLRKGRAEKVLAMLKRGHKKFGVVFKQ